MNYPLHNMEVKLDFLIFLTQMADRVSSLYLIRILLKIIFQCGEYKKIQGKIITFSALSLVLQLYICICSK